PLSVPLSGHSLGPRVPDGDAGVAPRDPGSRRALGARRVMAAAALRAAPVRAGGAGSRPVRRPGRRASFVPGSAPAARLEIRVAPPHRVAPRDPAPGPPDRPAAARPHALEVARRAGGGA